MFKSEIIKAEPINIEKLPYPKEEIEHLVSQIIRVSKENAHDTYSHDIDETLSILNDMLRLLTKPIMVINNE